MDIGDDFLELWQVGPLRIEQKLAGFDIAQDCAQRLVEFVRNVGRQSAGAAIRFKCLASSSRLRDSNSA